MQQKRPPFVRFKQETWCVEAAQRDPRAAAFLLNKNIPLDLRFAYATGILCPTSPETVRTLH